MKAITLWQPWAGLIANGSKRYETRSWNTKHRGRLAIHSAQTIKGLQYAIDNEIPLPENMQFGKVLCLVDLIEVYKTEELAKMLPPDQLKLGDFSPGRFAWMIKLLYVWENPIPASGSQGFWNWEEPGRDQQADRIH